MLQMSDKSLSIHDVQLMFYCIAWPVNVSCLLHLSFSTARYISTVNLCILSFSFFRKHFFSVLRSIRHVPERSICHVRSGWHGLGIHRHPPELEWKGTASQMKRTQRQLRRGP